MRRLVAPARVVGAALLLLAPWGWLDLLRRLPLPGPRLADALPLYEAAGRDRLPVLLVAAAWGAAVGGAALLLPPWRPLVRTALLVVLAVVPAAVVEAVQLELVRQADVGVPVGQALRTPLPWLLLALAVAAGRALATRRRPRDTGDAAGDAAEPAPDGRGNPYAGTDAADPAAAAVGPVRAAAADRADPVAVAGAH